MSHLSNPRSMFLMHVWLRMFSVSQEFNQDVPHHKSRKICSKFVLCQVFSTFLLLPCGFQGSKKWSRVSRIAQQVKFWPQKPDELSSIPRIHVKVRENWLYSFVFRPPHTMPWQTCTLYIYKEVIRHWLPKCIKNIHNLTRHYITDSK